MQMVRANESRLEGLIEHVFDNRGRFAETQFAELSALYDEQTIRHIEKRGIDEGWSCLEVGGGSGSIASWLSMRVGATGRVLATDINPECLQALSFPNLEVQRHDIRFEGLPKQQFDLVHARLLLMHLPGRELALQQMLASLRPGGWIVVEDFDVLSILPDAAVNPGEEELKILRACHVVLTARGTDLRYGRRLPQRLRTLGLSNVGAEASVSLWKGHSAGTSLFRLSLGELGDPIVRSGLMSQAQFEADIRRLDEKDFFMPSPMMWSAWGQVPGARNRHGNTCASRTAHESQESEVH
jgi:SAM-dependent methyltransferase